MDKLSDTQRVKAQAVAKRGAVSVPPINLMNIESVRYLFGFYPFLIKSETTDQSTQKS